MKTGNLDGQGLAQLQNYKFQMLSSAPSPSEALFYYDTSLHSFRYYNGTQWIDGTKFAAGLGIDASALTSGTIKADFTQVATAAQGALADTALQPNDDISELNNDAGYITNAAIGNGALTIQRNGTGVGTFTANQTTGTTVNITVPTSATDVGALPSTTTINDLTTAAQQAALNSGVTTSIVGQVGTNASDISDIEALIPNEATSSNQLADKSFVNSSIATNTAYFIGTFNSLAELEAYTGTVTNNDYAFVVTTDSDNNTVYKRYKYNGDTSEWIFEYDLNNSSFTAAQWAAINSGVTSTSVSTIASNTSAISGLQSSKQDKLTQGSNITISGNTISATNTTYSNGTGLNLSGTTFSVNFNAVATAAQGSKADTALQSIPVAGTSVLGGVKVGNNLSIDANGVLSADAQQMTVDSALSTTSTNPVQNKVITTALASKSTVTFVDWTV